MINLLYVKFARQCEALKTDFPKILMQIERVRIRAGVGGGGNFLYMA